MGCPYFALSLPVDKVTLSLVLGELNPGQVLGRAAAA
jgi:hypothetical protein